MFAILLYEVVDGLLFLCKVTKKIRVAEELVLIFSLFSPKYSQCWSIVCLLLLEWRYVRFLEIVILLF